MGAPARFDLVEQGAGRGLLARDIVRAASRDAGFAAALRYQIVEPSVMLRDEQQRTLDEAGIEPDAVTWSDAAPDAIAGVVLTNELLDAFPAHRVVRRGDDLLEVFVAHDGQRFTDELRPLSGAAIRDYFNALGVAPGDGCYAEVNLAAPAWLSDVASRLQRGYVLTFDYGYEAASLYAPWRRDGTLLCFSGQAASSDPYQRIGRQDITASVDFTTLRATGEACGLTTIATTDQSSFLVRLGIGEGVAEAAGEMEEYFARRSIVMALIDPARLGRVTVLLQGKGVPNTTLSGFTDG
jgi:SAM-dependent MidA family methyltransferase